MRDGKDLSTVSATKRASEQSHSGRKNFLPLISLDQLADLLRTFLWTNANIPLLAEA